MPGWRSALAWAVLAGSISAAPASAGNTGPRLHFRRVATLARLACRDASTQRGLLLTDRVRVVVELRSRRGCGELLALNVLTGRIRTFAIRGHDDPVALGGGFALFTAPYRLLDLTHGRWETIRCPGGCEPSDAFAARYDVGRHWVQMTFMLAGDCGDGVHEGCGPTVTRFYDISHRRVVSPPAKDDAHVYDPDAPGLVRPLCRPLRDVTGDGYLSLLGRFALVFSGGGNAYTGPPTPSLLEACGTPRRTAIAAEAGADPETLFLATPRAILWNSGGPGSGIVAGLRLPSRRPFTARVPDWFAEGEPAYDGLVGRRLYGIDRAGHLEAAMLPNG